MEELLSYKLSYCTGLQRAKFIQEFNSINIEKICSNLNVIQSTTVLFCVLKNEYPRICQFLNYYRNIGINTFVFLDNDSTDGTFEYLKSQKGVTLYHTSDSYSSFRRVIWLNYLLLLHGTDKWCVVVDSDEYLTYEGYENYKISEVIYRAEENHLVRLEGLLLDMYPKGELFMSDSGNFFNDNIYFDKSGYVDDYGTYGKSIKGGPRNRIFGCNICLSKYPLFYYSEDMFYANSHYLLPVIEGDHPIWFAIRHYKFIDRVDFNKILVAVENRNYFNASHEYMTYLQTINKNKHLRFYDEQFSAEFIDSSSLKQISKIANPFS